jgi:para-nitrobenzyl esterase
MRAKTTAEIVAAVPAGTPPPTVLPPGPWSPTVNGYDIVDTPSNLLATGEVMSIPVIQGIMKHEGAFYGMQERFFAAVQGRPFPPDAARYQTLIRSLFTAPGAADAVLTHYPASSYATPLAAYTAAIGHGWHNCPQARTTRAFVARGLTTYSYIFNYSGMAYTSPQTPELSGATHTQEAAYIFGNDWVQIPNLQGIFENRDVPVVKSMMKYWSSFARTGTPTNEEGVAWPALTAGTTKHLVIDSTVSVQDASPLMVPPSMHDGANSRCGFFDGLNP